MVVGRGSRLAGSSGGCGTVLSTAWSRLAGKNAAAFTSPSIIEGDATQAATAAAAAGSNGIGAGVVCGVGCPCTGRGLS